MAHSYTVIFEKEAEGGYHVFCPTLPGCHTQSETVEEGVESIREAVGLYIESLVEDGLAIPTEDILIKPIEIAVGPLSCPPVRQRTWFGVPSDWGLCFGGRAEVMRFMCGRATRLVS